MAEQKQMYGYVGKILRIDLTNSKTEVLSTEPYIPMYIGGRALCTKLFWDEVGPGVGAFDPENKLIFATGPTTGTGIPTGGRVTMGGIAPNSLPEQYSYGSIGGWIGTVLKYAGYDAIIIEGKAPKHTYVMIDDDKVSFCDAEPIWGMTVHNTQQSILLAQGRDTFSMVIGPAGENLHRNATITTSMDHVFAKNGFGAVFGSKNLKAVAIRGTGKVVPADIKKVFELRRTVGDPDGSPNPPVKMDNMCSGENNFKVPGGWMNGKLCCSPGCNSRCQRLLMNTTSFQTGEKINQIEKCIGPYDMNMTYDLGYQAFVFVHSKRNNRSVGMNRSYPKPPDKQDPDYEMCSELWVGDRVDYYGPDFERGAMQNQMCNEYGLDKWDIHIWYFTWLSMAKKEGLLDDLDFGMEVDVEDPAFVAHFIRSMVYREGIGDIFAEGMARAIRILGKEKYGDTIYHGRFNAKGENLALPVSLEAGWGHCVHWLGRGYQSAPKWLWVSHALNMMVNTRDSISSSHLQSTPDDVRRYLAEGALTSRYLMERSIWNENSSVVKDSITTCEWQSPDLFWTSLEADLYQAATGDREMTTEKLYEYADASRLLFRAILMRNYGRCRELETKELFPILTYPDSNGETLTWEEWNSVVDLYYEVNGWDKKTGWPYRSTWEKAGLKDVADELDRLGMIPPED